eukprot:scaffold5148_cov229-Pinguiococcus_pyrenoidosus.AAC.1
MGTHSAVGQKGRKIERVSLYLAYRPPVAGSKRAIMHCEPFSSTRSCTTLICSPHSLARYPAAPVRGGTLNTWHASIRHSSRSIGAAPSIFAARTSKCGHALVRSSAEHSGQEGLPAVRKLAQESGAKSDKRETLANFCPF